jgi:hypothetical protein
MSSRIKHSYAKGGSASLAGNERLVLFSVLWWKLAGHPKIV